MRLPDWLPQVNRPWNPAYRDVWDSMTPNEKRWSFVLDCLVSMVFTIILMQIGGCALL